MLQVCRDATHPVITVLGVRRVDSIDEVARILPDAPTLSAPLWWVDTVTPFGPEGEPGVTAALEASMELDAVCIVTATDRTQGPDPARGWGIGVSRACSWRRAARCRP